MKKIINTIFGFGIFVLSTFVIPLLVQAQSWGSKLDTGDATSSFYIAVEQLSLLQRVFGIATKPEIMMIITIISIISIVGLIYLTIGFVIFLLFINKE